MDTIHAKETAQVGHESLDSSNGYVWKWELYTGKQERGGGGGGGCRPISSSGDVIVKTPTAQRLPPLL